MTADIERELRDIKRGLASIPARFATPQTTPPIQLVEIKPPLGVVQPDYEAATIENAYPLGYKMAGGGNNARDKFTFTSGTIMSGMVVSGTLNCSGNIYSGCPTVAIYNRFNATPPGMPVYAVPISSTSGSPMEVIHDCQETIFVTMSGTIGSGSISPGTSPSSPVFSGSNVSAPLSPYPSYGQAGTRTYPCYKANGGGQASGMMSLQQSLPDAEQAFNVIYDGPWVAPGATLIAHYTGPYSQGTYPDFAWAATAVVNAQPQISGTATQYNFELPIYGNECSGGTALSCVSIPSTSAGPFVVPVQNVGNGSMSSGSPYIAHWLWQKQAFCVCANVCCASGQYTTSGSMSSGG